MNLSDAYSGNWLKAEHLQGRDWTLTISEVVGKHKFDDGSEQIVIAFAETERSLGLNWTNASTVADLYGDTDLEETWKGKKIVVYPTTTDFGKKRNIPCIRIRAFDPTRAAQVAAERAAAPPAPAPQQDDHFIVQNPAPAPPPQGGPEIGGTPVGGPHQPIDEASIPF